MNHLTDTQLITHVFDRFALTASESAHLMACALCRMHLQGLENLGRELAIARQSQPTLKSLSSYYQLFRHLPQAPVRLANVLQTMHAVLTWDSRQQPALRGVRTATAPTYRQLYTTECAEIELVVATHSQQCDLEGEIIASCANGLVMPALIQLQPYTASAHYATQSDARGRFCIFKVAPGRYALVIRLLSGLAMMIDELEII